jgi:CheY-like chemotaxis protein
MTRVLIVDDHAEIRHLVKLALEPTGYDLDEAADAASALDRIYLAPPDILVLDVMMPGNMDGYALCKQIKDSPEWRHICVILLTARGQQTDMERGKAAHADAYLVKPFSPTALWSLVQRAGEGQCPSGIQRGEE